MIRTVSLRAVLTLGLPFLLAALPTAQAQEAPQSSRGGAAKPQAERKPESKPSASAQKGTDKKAADKKADEKKGADAKKGAKPAGPGGAQATLLANFGDWGAYASQQGRSKICYALAKPKEQQPKDKRSPAYLFVSFRPSENVRNEVAVVMGLSTRDGGEAEAVIGKSTYALVTKDQNAWIKNPAEENQVVATMSKGQTLVVKAASKAGTRVTDSYSLNGFGPALDRARKECS